MPNTKKGSKGRFSGTPCKDSVNTKKRQDSSYALFRKIVSGDMKVDDNTIKIISKCDQQELGYVMGKNT